MKVRRQHVALVLAATALFAALGGPAYAASLINGKTIKPKSITSTQLADGSVTLAKLASSARTALKGPAGTVGAAGDGGAVGPTGPIGDRGPSTVYDIYDRAGHRLGRDVGLFVSFQAFLTDGGAILAYSSMIADPNAISLANGPLYYKVAGCAGQPYLMSAGLPVDLGQTLESPATPGSQVWVAVAAPFESFTAASSRTSGGCTNGSTGLTGALPARQAGTIPTVQKPLLYKAAG